VAQRGLILDGLRCHGGQRQPAAFAMIVGAQD